MDLPWREVERMRACQDAQLSCIHIPLLLSLTAFLLLRVFNHAVLKSRLAHPLTHSKPLPRLFDSPFFGSLDFAFSARARIAFDTLTRHVDPNLPSAPTLRYPLASYRPRTDLAERADR